MLIEVKPDYIELLNEAVSREIQVSLQYMLQHSKMEKILRKTIPENVLLDKTTYEVMGKFLKEFAIQEMKHAAAVMERIYYLGGSATTKADKPKIGNTLSEFASNGVQAEKEALELYRRIIEIAGKIGDWETRELFEKIYTEEEKHLIRFQEYVDIIDEPEHPEAPVSVWRKVFTQDYFEMLNQAAASEISAIIQYINQHEKANLLALRKKSTPLEVVSENNKDKIISELLKEISLQEMEHLEKISERIYLLEGETTTVPDPLPQVGESADDFIRLGHSAENDAIILYRTIIEEALKRGDTATRQIFEQIIIQEEEHYWKFDDYLR